MSKGATSRLRASAGLLNMDGHAEEVAARSRTEEMTVEGFMAEACTCAWTVAVDLCPREGFAWSYGDGQSSGRTRGAPMLSLL